MFLFFQIKLKATWDYNLYLPIKVQMSLLYQKISFYSFKPVLECKQQVDNNTLTMFLKGQNSQRKKKKLFWNSEN